MNRIAQLRTTELRDKIRRSGGRNTAPTNNLTRAIIRYIVLNGGHAERVNNIARRVVDKTGTERHIPSTNLRGTADIHAVKPILTIKHDGIAIGLAVMIEVKTGKDRQSDAQRDYQQMIERAGGVYLIVRSFDDFLQKWGEI